MPEKFLSRNVKRETDEHYRGGWPLHADARRFLYLEYARYPQEVALSRGEHPAQREPRDIWKEAAAVLLDEIGNGDNMRGIDVGASSGYFIRQLLEGASSRYGGFKGEIVGVDIETGHQPFLQWELQTQYPEATIVLGGSNAQSLREIKVVDDENQQAERLKIRKDSFDFLTELFVLYHVPDFERAYNAAHRALKPGGIAIFSGRHHFNQQGLWNLGAIIASDFGVSEPESFYTHHDLHEMEEYLRRSPKFEFISGVRQAENIWIPAVTADQQANEAGWAAMVQALKSLPYGKREVIRNGKAAREPITNEWFEREYLETAIRRQYFEQQAAANHGYFVDNIFQDFYVVRAIK